MVKFNFPIASVQKDPTRYKKATNSGDKIFRKQAIKEELYLINKKSVWEIVDRQKVKADGKKSNITESKCVFKKKIWSDGKIRYKARFW